MDADRASPHQTVDGAAIMRRVGWRIVPFLVLCYFIAYVDRVNAGFAALTMNEDLGLSRRCSASAAGLFFVAYVLFEVPSNIAMEQVGARLWIARIMITWGLVGVGDGLRRSGPYSFYRVPLPARRGRGRVLPRRDPLPDLLVPEGLPGPDRRDVHGRDPALELPRLAALGGAAAARRRSAGCTAGSGCSSSRRSRPCCWASPPWSCCRAGPREAKWLAPERAGWLQDRLDGRARRRRAGRRTTCRCGRC